MAISVKVGSSEEEDEDEGMEGKGKVGIEERMSYMIKMMRNSRIEVKVSSKD